MNKYIFLALIMFGLVSCEKSQIYADKLKGTWKITEISGDPTVISPEAVNQFLIFLPCNDAYTATCKVNYIYEDLLSNTNDTSRLDFTLKDDYIHFINASIPSFSGIGNFNKVFKQQRFLIKELTNENLQLERVKDSLHVQAVKL
jgi:hypothetical protein